MDPLEIMKFRITVQFLLGVLAGDLYKNRGYSLWEIVRNAVCACMPHGKWIAGAGDVEIFLKEHPLGGNGKALIVLDHGSGFSSEGFKRFCSFGTPEEDILAHPQGIHSDASQKCTGRWAMYALNEECLRNKNGSTGAAILTRRRGAGKVTLMSLTPNVIVEQQGIVQQLIAADAPEMGFLAGIEGSFTAVIIANPVFANYSEIREALKWRVPRRKDQMFELKIGGERFIPPTLATEINIPSPGGVIHMHLERASKEDLDAGVYFADAATGIRVAAAWEIGFPHVIYPYDSREISGDIFMPNLLGKQDSARKTLTSEFLRSREWQKHKPFFASQQERVRGLLGEGEPQSRSPVSAAMAEFTEICNRVFGEPERREGEEVEINREEKPPRNPPPDTVIVRKPHGPKEPGVQPPGEPRSPRKKPMQCVRIGAKTYGWLRRPDDSDIPVRVDRETIFINPDYAHLPSRREQRNEHFWQNVLIAVAQYEKPTSAYDDVLHKVGEWRRLMFK